MITSSGFGLFLTVGLAFLVNKVSGTCTVCGEATPMTVTDACITLMLEGGSIEDEMEDACTDLRARAAEECGCPSTTSPSQSCELCGPGVALPDPDRAVYIEGAEPTTCAELEQGVSESRQLCDASIDLFQFYCGCPGVLPSCSLCPSSLSPVPNLVLKGYEPGWFPDPDLFTCEEMERQRSLNNETACTETQEDVSDIALLCGCFIPEELVNCTTICPDGTLTDPAVWENEALNEQPGFGTMTCQEYEFAAASGLFSGLDCDDANYVGIKRCGCLATKPYCDICEDGTPVETLEQEVTFGMTCLNYAGDAYFVDPQDEICVAFQSTAGIYCGCDNPIASQDACRLCDERGGDVVNDPNLTIPVGQLLADCGELELIGNYDGNQQRYTCEDMIDFGVQCCEFAPSTTPTMTPAPTITMAPTTLSPTMMAVSPPPLTPLTPPPTPAASPADGTNAPAAPEGPTSDAFGIQGATRWFTVLVLMAGSLVFRELS